MTIPTWKMSVPKVTGLVNKYVYQMVTKYTTANKFIFLWLENDYSVEQELITMSAEVLKNNHKLKMQHTRGLSPVGQILNTNKI